MHMKSWLIVFLLSLSPIAASANNLPTTIMIQAGDFVHGSDSEEREYAYRLDEKGYGHSITRKNKWYENEYHITTSYLDDFHITTNLITNSQYAQFVSLTNHPAPYVDRSTWKGYRLIHPYARVEKFLWQNNQPPKGRDNHPVVLIDYFDAVAFAEWLSATTKSKWRLPTELEWQKAAGGQEGNRFPWGAEFDPENLNSHDLGPFDTIAAGSYPNASSPYGVLDMAGQVFEWTSTPSSNTRQIVKGGGSWDDRGCGICRTAARHSRPQKLKHILIGFRLVKEAS